MMVSVHYGHFHSDVDVFWISSDAIEMVMMSLHYILRVLTNIKWAGNFVVAIYLDLLCVSYLTVKREMIFAIIKKLKNSTKKKFN